MAGKPSNPPDASGAKLRAQVARLRARLAAAQKFMAEHRDCRRLIADLRVYHEETRQQAEQLMQVQAALEEPPDRFANPYDFAPMAYMSLDVNGAIAEIN